MFEVTNLKHMSFNLKHAIKLSDKVTVTSHSLIEQIAHHDTGVFLLAYEKACAMQNSKLTFSFGTLTSQYIKRGIVYLTGPKL